jgi:hypothetical protein
MHVAHAIAAKGMRLMHKHKDGSWDYGECDSNAIAVLQLIANKADAVIDACNSFRLQEDHLTQQHQQFLDLVEAALKPLLVAKKLQEERQ